MDVYIKRNDVYALFPNSGFARLHVADIDKIQTVEAELVTHGRREWFEEWSLSTSCHPAECEDCGWRCSECKTALEDIVGGYWDDIYTKSL